MPRQGERTSAITTWKMKKSDLLVDVDGKLFIVKLDEIFQQPKFAVYNKFSIKKGSYENQLDVIVRYTNFFMKFYDPEKELAMAYLKCKFAIDKDKLFTKDNMQAMIDFIYDVMITDTMVTKIEKMVEDNYLDDIEGGKDGKYSAKGKKYLESLEFTNEHMKILLAISFCMKIMSPVMFHYFSINLMKCDKETFYIYEFYKRLFDVFGTKCNMYNKLFVYVKAKVLESKANNEGMFQQREILGWDELTVIHRFVRQVLIEENMVKYKFNEHWNPRLKKYKESIVGFNKTIIKFQLIYFLKEEYEKNLTEITFNKNSDGLSGVDKMAMNISKTDEGDLLLAEVNAEDIVEEIQKTFDIPISEEELQYYQMNHAPSKEQIRLVYTYYGKLFGNARDCKLVTFRQYLIMMLTLKKKLLFDIGVKGNEHGVVESGVLPYIISGNLEGHLNTRIIRNVKFNSTLTDSYQYQELKSSMYNLLEEIKPEELDSLISTFVNSSYSYCCYERPDLLGKIINCSDNKVSDELTFFLRSCQ